MNRIEFMTGLEILLVELTDEERVDALSFYHNYFDDAGTDEEENVIKELGTPAEVAEKIKESIFNVEESVGEYTETGYRDERFEQKQEFQAQGMQCDEYTKAGGYDGNSSDEVEGEYKEVEGKGSWFQQKYRKAKTFCQNQYHKISEFGKNQYSKFCSFSERQATKLKSLGRKKKEKKEFNIWKLIAITLLIIIGWPVILVVIVFGAIIWILVAVLFDIFTILVALSGLAVFFGGIFLFIGGITQIFTSPFLGIGLCMLGIVVASLGVILAVIMVKVAIKTVPAMIRNTIEIIRKPFHKEEE